MRTNRLESHVTQGDIQEKRPWWETELPAVKKGLLIYLRSHVPALRYDHDDLVSETLISLTQYLDGHVSDLPGSWFQEGSPRRDEQARLHRLATVILKRRIADNFRKRVALRNQVLEAYEDCVYESPLVGQERQVTMARILEVVRSALDEMPPEDRDLIALISQDAASRTALNTRDRQRLHRIRKKLKEHIARRLGSDVVDLLKTPT